MDKFCLKWNDFQINASKTFRDLRREEDFFDVTLVSDDEKHIAAHKLVLSASSEVFKNILRKASHSNPMIYLNGFNSKDLNLIINMGKPGSSHFRDPSLISEETPLKSEAVSIKYLDFLHCYCIENSRYICVAIIWKK